MREISEFDAIQSRAPIFKSLSGIAHTMAIKCALDLRLADILHSHEGPISLSQLASSIDLPTPPDIFVLKCVMRLLVHDKIFTAHQPSDGGETLYGATKTSSWLLFDSKTSLYPVISVHFQPSMTTPWCYLSQCVKEGGTAFEKVHGCKMFEFASQNLEFSEGFIKGMAAQSERLTMTIVDKYNDGLKNVGSLVDVRGGTGEALAVIVREFPHIKGINFDLPHVVSMAPEYDGVTHVGGDMFEAIVEINLQRSCSLMD